MKKEDLNLIAKTLNGLNMIWFSLFFSVLAYTVAGLALKGLVGITFGEKALNYIRTFFYLLTLVNITSAVYIRNKHLEEARERKNLEEVLEMYKKAVIVSVSVAELIGVYGLLLLLIGDRFYGFPLVITSGLVMLYLRPRRGEILSLLE